MSTQKNIDKEYNLEDEAEALRTEERALQNQPQITDESLPTKLYLEKTTIPQIYEALQVLAKERPLNPIEFFSYYLLTHNKKPAADDHLDQQNGQPQEEAQQQA